MTTDSRHSILLAVRDQASRTSDHLHEFGNNQQALWSQQQWWEAFQFLFVEDGGQLSKQQSKDDMLFFVLAKPPEPTKQRPDPAPFIVRRKTVPLPQDLQLSGDRFSEILWDCSVLLNIVLQASFQLTVVACRQDQVALLSGGTLSSTEVLRVAKTVFASPTFTAVNLDSSRSEASEPVVTYPDICFAVDTFDDTFEDVVLSDPGQCYCVLLSAAVDDDLTYSFSRHLTAELSTAPSTSVPPSSPASVPSSTVDLHSTPPSRRTTFDNPPQPTDKHPTWDPTSHPDATPTTDPCDPSTATAPAPLQAPSPPTDLSPDASQPPPPSGQQPRLTAGSLDAEPSWDSNEELLPSASGVVAQYADLSIAADRRSSDAAGGGVALAPSPSSLAAKLGRASQHGGALQSEESVRTVWGARRVELFAGFVSQSQITGHLNINKQERANHLAVLGAILAGGRQQQRERIIMTGPGGLGRAEVAVTVLPPAGQPQPAAEGGGASNPPGQPHALTPQQSLSGGQGGVGQAGGGGGGMLKARLMQRVKDIAGQVSKAIAEERLAASSVRDGVASLQCALITLRLPVHVVAQKLLSVL